MPLNISTNPNKHQLKDYVNLSVSISLFNGISTFVGYLMPNSSFKKNSSVAI